MKTLLSLLALLVSFTCLAFDSSSVTVEWNPNTESNLAGYRVYVGKGSRDYNRTFDTTNTFFVVTNVPGETFYAVTAFDTDNLESDFSDEVSTTIKPKAPGNFRLRAQVTIQAADDVTGPWDSLAMFSLVEPITTSRQFYRARWLFP